MLIKFEKIFCLQQGVDLIYQKIHNYIQLYECLNDDI